MDMNHKVAGTIAVLMALFFLYATMTFANMPKAGGAALVSALFFAVLLAVACFAFAQTKKIDA
jgi:hypothetical protein